MSLPLDCPACGSAMRPEARAGVTLDRCPVCGEVWCDRTELAAVVSAERPGTTVSWGRPVEEAAGTARPLCPRDGTPTLRPFALDGISFRRCSTCRGVALAASDLQRLLLESDGPGPALRDALGRLAS
ncbi:MAG TPA: zf-TFIIB domain-containing protein [Gemmatimonadales bacterium]|nr:zf-TFIIB domain-containing protein [Gemmatimonadales bacterium]